MYNVARKIIGKIMIKEYIKRYVYYLIIFVITNILFVCLSYEKLNQYSKLISFNVNNKKYDLQNEIVINENKDIYMSYSDIQQFLDSDLYIDKISRKIILTSHTGVRKYELNTTKRQVNFSDEIVESAIYVKNKGIDYLLLEEIADMYNNQIVFNDKLNTLDLESQDKVIGTLKFDRTFGYLEKKHKNTRLIIAEDKVEIIKNDDFYDKENEFYTAVINKNDEKLVIFILKNDIRLEAEDNNSIIQSVNTKFYTFFFNEENTNLDKVTNGVVLGGLKLISKNGYIENTINNDIIDTANKNNKEVYISLNNGYTSSNYDNSITTQMLQSDISREQLIISIAGAIENIEVDGIVINFRKLNANCKEEYTQFIKEISAYLHSINKNLIVYVPLEASFIDLKKISIYADFVILIQYGSKDITSKTSGTHSGINWIETNLTKLKQDEIEMSKVIIEIPLYSILWIEKNNKVIDAERINIRALEDYIAKNNLNSRLDEVSKQNYVEFIKGNLKYKIWLEDVFSVKQKMDLAGKYGLAGISLYKQGYENQSLLNEIGGC